MRTIIAIVVAAGMAGSAWLFSNQVEIRGLEDVRLAPRVPSTVAEQTAASPAAVSGTGRLRIASIDLGDIDEVTAGRPYVTERLASVVREFDIVALQGISSPSDEPVSRLAAAASGSERKYQFIISPAVGPPEARERYAFLFDVQIAEIDLTESYLVNDPHDRLRCDPFVAWFRARGVPPQEAFTFSLAAVRADRDHTFEELDALADVFVRVREDGRGEDDLIVLGNLNADDQNLARLGDLPRIACAISGTPTNTRGDRQLENLVFDSRATNEFTGRVGVFDIVREFNLSLAEAMEISEHLPVWAEFSVYEGGRQSAAGR